MLQALNVEFMHINSLYVKTQVSSLGHPNIRKKKGSCVKLLSKVSLIFQQ